MPAYFAVWQGQISVLLAVTVVFAWLALRARREALGGLALSALLAKPQYAVLVPLFFLFQGRWRAAAGFALGAGVLAVSSTLLVGAGGMSQWFELVAALPRLGSDYGHHAELQFTLSGLISAITDRSFVLTVPFSGIALLWLGLEALTFFGLTRIWRPRPGIGGERLFGLQFAGLLIGILLLSLHTNIQDLVLVFVAGVLAWDAIRERGAIASKVAILLIGVHMLFLALFVVRIAVQPVPYPNVFVVPLLALALLLMLWTTNREALISKDPRSLPRA
jgi:hypothetical protein